MLNNKELKALQIKWYDKLKKSGFTDIEAHDENPGKPDGNLKDWHSQMFQSSNTPVLFQQRERYYQLAGQFLHEWTFSDAKEKVVWQCHSNGMSTREISRQLNRDGYGKNAVFLIVKRLRTEMFKIYGVTK